MTLHLKCINMKHINISMICIDLKYAKLTGYIDSLKMYELPVILIFK